MRQQSLHSRRLAAGRTTPGPHLSLQVKAASMHTMHTVTLGYACTVGGKHLHKRVTPGCFLPPTHLLHLSCTHPPAFAFPFPHLIPHRTLTRTLKYSLPPLFLLCSTPIRSIQQTLVHFQAMVLSWCTFRAQNLHFIQHFTKSVYRTKWNFNSLMLLAVHKCAQNTLWLHAKHIHPHCKWICINVAWVQISFSHALFCSSCPCRHSPNRFASDFWVAVHRLRTRTSFFFFFLS